MRPALAAALLVVGPLSASTQTPVSLPAKNYVVNGGFERGEEGWSHFVHEQGAIDRSVFFAGDASFRMGRTDPDRHSYFWQYDLPLETGKTYTLSARMRSEALSPAALEFGVLLVTNHGWTESVALAPPEATCEWTPVSQTFAAFPTTPRPDGGPAYNIVVYRAPGTAGKVWIDDVQIEEGTSATPFTDVDIRAGIETRAVLQSLSARLGATREALADFQDAPAHATLQARLNATQAKADIILGDLARYAELPSDARARLPARADAAARELAGIRTIVWTGPAHIPLGEVAVPAEMPDSLDLELTCLRGEHRDVAINVANLTGAGFPLRLAASDLYHELLAHAVPGDVWLSAYTVPLMRGAARPDERFTDALPQLNDAGIAAVRETGISQVVVSLDASTLYPGRYEGRLTLESTLDKATRREIGVSVTVLPRQLPRFDDLDITDCYGHVEYAWPALVALGVNTFSLSASWAGIEFDDDGRVVRFEPDRIQRMVRRICGDVPNARFLLLNVQKMLGMVTGRTGWAEDDPRVETAIRSWLEQIAECLRDAGVPSGNLIVETWDEPGPGDRAMARRMARWVKKASPEARTQFYVTGIEHDDDWAATARAHDIVAPIVAACTDENMKFLRSLTEQVWLYDCQAYGETFDPLAYYRLMPWTCRAYDLSGWGQFHWFNTSHGRAYRAWDGVEAQNLVYPTRDGRGWVATRRYLAARAGHEDYATIRALEQDTPDPDADDAFIDTACNRALAMAPRQKGYHTQIEADADPALLDNLREEAVGRLAVRMPPPEPLPVSLSEDNGAAVLNVTAPNAGRLGVRWLIDGALPWHETQRDVPAGKVRIPLADEGDVTRCLVDFVDSHGRIRVGVPLLIPTITVDSVSEPYGATVLNDGIRAVASKFEPSSAWVSSADAVEHWVEMDLHREHRVREVTLYWMTFTGLPRKTRVDALADDGTWRPMSATPDWRPAPGPVDRVVFAPVNTRRLRVVMAPLGGGPGGPALMGLSEVEVR